MNGLCMTAIAMSFVAPICADAANPFLGAPDDKPMSAKFCGTSIHKRLRRGAKND